MNVLVIGGNGFIGSHLVSHLLLHRHRVRVIDIANEKYRKPLPAVDYRIASLDDLAQLYEALLDVDVVFHLASTSVPSTSNIDTVADINKNLIATLNVLNLVVKRGIRRFVYFSSGGAVYGPTSTSPIPEEHALEPISSYGIVKAAGERYVALYQRKYGIKSLIVRPSNPYGPRQGHYIAQGVVSTFLRKIWAGEPLTVYGDGSSKKDYIYIDDFIAMCYNLSVSAECGAFNIGSGEGTTLNSIIEHIRSVTGTDPRISFSGVPDYDVSNFVLDISKVRRSQPDTPATSMESGIRSVWEWMNEQRGDTSL